MIQRKTSLLENLLMFFRYLREKGFAIGPQHEADTLLAIQKVEAFRNPDAFRMTLKAMLCNSLKTQNRFDELYAQFFKELEKAADSKITEGPTGEQSAKSIPGSKGPTLEALKNWLYNKKDSEQDSTELAQYSALEAFTTKDFSNFSKAGLEELSSLLRKLKRQLVNQKSLREAKSKKPGQLDVRRTIRANLRNGTELLELHYRDQKIDKLKIVLLCDVSRSMELYSRFLVQFMFGFQQIYKRMETFVFSTRLYRITKELQYREFGEALEAISETVPGWSGGTRIGESLDQFVVDYSNRLLDRKTIVMILSDGWDTGDADLLGSSMKFIHRKAERVIWLNPLAGNPNYKPEAVGMKAAWPYIDTFAPAHNLESFKSILPFLGNKRKQKQIRLNRSF